MRAFPCIAAIGFLVAGCGPRAMSPEAGAARGGASLYAEPGAATAMFFAGAVDDAAYDYDAMTAAGTLGCMKDEGNLSPHHGARLVEGGAVELAARGSVTLVPVDRDTGAHVLSSTAPLFAPGEEVTMRTRGARDVPALEATAVAPPPVALASPHAGDVLDRANDIVLRWANTDGFVDVIVVTPGESWPCVFDARRGTGRIAQHFFEEHPPEKVTLRIASVRTATKNVAGWHVSLSVASARAEIALSLR